MTTVRTVISVMGRFHAFDLARELDRRGRLATLFTSYPSALLPRFGVDQAMGRTLPWLELSARALRKVAPSRGRRYAPWFARRYDRWVASQLKEGPTTFIGWSGQCRASLERARELGMTTIVERGSAHIEVQRDLLAAEFERAGLRPVLPHPAVVEAELAEYESADFIQVPSNFARRSFLERGIDPEKILVNAYGVELGAFTPPEREPAGFRILFCGRASVQKGIGHLLAGFAALDAPDAELWIQGAVEPDAEHYRSRCDDARVKWLGHRPQHELPSVYREAHAFCLPSIQDGFALVVPQAMASGLPVVVTSSNGAADMVREGVDGHIIPPGDAGAIAQALKGLYTDRERRRTMAAAAVERVRAGWSWNAYGERAVDLLERAHASITDARRVLDGPGAKPSLRRAG